MAGAFFNTNAIEFECSFIWCGVGMLEYLPITSVQIQRNEECYHFNLRRDFWVIGQIEFSWCIFPFNYWHSAQTLGTPSFSITMTTKVLYGVIALICWLIVHFSGSNNRWKGLPFLRRHLWYVFQLRIFDVRLN